MREQERKSEGGAEGGGGRGGDEGRERRRERDVGRGKEGEGGREEGRGRARDWEGWRAEACYKLDPPPPNFSYSFTVSSSPLRQSSPWHCFCHPKRERCLD